MGRPARTSNDRLHSPAESKPLAQCLEERRRYPRAQVKLGVTWVVSSKEIGGLRTSLSEGGMLFKTPQPPTVGTVIGVLLHSEALPDPLFLKGRVIYHARSNDGQIEGAGVEFIEVPPRELAKLRFLVTGANAESVNIALYTRDEDLESMIRFLMAKHHHNVVGVPNLKELSRATTEKFIHLVLFDPGPASFDMKKFRSAIGGLPAVLIQSEISPTLRVEAAQYGITEILEKPVEANQLMLVIRRQLRNGHAGQVAASRIALEDATHLVTRSKIMFELREEIEKLAPLSHPVLITGETGTGKSLIATTIHQLSQQKEESLVLCDCSCMGDNLAGSNLFGHEKGSFTGADRRHIGLVEQAKNSTLFLDEVGELSRECQAKLLRLIDEGMYRRLGGEQDLESRPRIIAATHRNLREMVKKGEFRQDLYYRLSMHKLEVPPLRERKEDIEEIAFQFLVEKNKEFKTNVISFGPKAQQQFVTHTWPGNVRELRNAIASSLMHINDAQESTLSELSIDQASAVEANQRRETGVGFDLPWARCRKMGLDKLERDYLCHQLARFKGNVSESAKFAGISRGQFTQKLKRYRVRRADFDQAVDS